jgi:hypothetical protein
MSKQVRFRRGTTAQHAVFTGPAGEVTVDTDKKVTVVHNGVTAGGIPTAREDRPRGWTKTELIASNGINWTQTNKPDLKRIIVWAWGGGGNGGSHAGGGAGGYGMVSLEASSVSTNVTVTIGGAGGGTTSFGSYISCTGGAAGSATQGGAPGVASGTGVTNLGASAGMGGGSAIHSPGQGGGIGGGNHGVAAKGFTGSGGGGGAAGSQGMVIVQEIYGFV